MQYALEINRLHKTYANGSVALRGIDLYVGEGDFFALLGPNGAGKSTAIGIITSLVNKTSGQVRIHGIDLHREPSRAKALLGLVPQEFNFNQFEPAFEVVCNQAGFYGISPPLAHKRTRQYLTHLGLWDKHKTEMRFLSGGMKRRLLIARALIHEPSLLILDEPTAGVDIEVRRMIWEFMRRINAAGTTIILTTHYLEEAESLCKNIAIIDHGSIIENTSMRTLLERLDIESFLLYLREPLRQMPRIDLPDITLKQVDAKTLEAVIRSDANLGRMFVELEKLGIQVLSIRNKVNRLEELFVNLIAK